MSAPSMRSSRTTRYSAIAARTFASASASVTPCDQHPGRPGTETLNPSSDRSSAILYFIGSSSARNIRELADKRARTRGGPEPDGGARRFTPGWRGETSRRRRAYVTSSAESRPRGDQPCTPPVYFVSDRTPLPVLPSPPPEIECVPPT